MSVTKSDYPKWIQKVILSISQPRLQKSAMTDAISSLGRLSHKVKGYINRGNDLPDNATCNVRISTPSNVDWTTRIEDALTHAIGPMAQSEISFSPSKEVFLIKQGSPYRRSLIDYSYFEDMRCMVSLMVNAEYKEDIPSDMMGGKCKIWILNSSKDRVMIFQPGSTRSTAPPVAGGSQNDTGVFTWMCEKEEDINLTNSVCKVFVRFNCSRGAIPSVDYIFTTISNIWCIVYNTPTPYFMHEAREVFVEISRSKRRTRMISQLDMTERTGYMKGYVCRPALSKKISKAYFTCMPSGIWLYHLASKTMCLLSRDSAGGQAKTAMMGMPVFLYSFEKWGFLDPVIPFDCRNVEDVRDRNGRNRIIYDVETLMQLAEECKQELSIVADSISVGSVWTIARGGDEAKYVNTPKSLQEYPHRVSFRQYVSGKSSLNLKCKLHGLVFISPFDDSDEILIEKGLEVQQLTVTSDGILCRLDMLQQNHRTSEYVCNAFGNSRDVVLYKGTKVFPFAHLAKGTVLRKNKVCVIQTTINSTLDLLQLPEVRDIGDFDADIMTSSLPSLSKAIQRWKAVCHPCWPMLNTSSSLHRMNRSMWASVSRCLDTKLECQRLLIVTRNLSTFYHTLENIPPTWDVVELNISDEVQEHDRAIEGVVRVDYRDMKVVLDMKAFDYVILNLCYAELNSTDTTFKGVIEEIIRDCKMAISLALDRGMIEEHPFNFRYRFGDTTLKTFVTSGRDVQVWTLDTAYSRLLECPVDLDEACVFMTNCDLSLSPTVPPVHLSDFVFKCPDWSPHMMPEKLQVCLCFQRAHESIPSMEFLVSRRDFGVSRKIKTDPGKVARVGRSDFFLLLTPQSEDAMIHALLVSSSQKFFNLGSDLEGKKAVVDAYKQWMRKELMKPNPNVVHVYKGVFVKPIHSLDVCIMDILQGGLVTSTLLQRTTPTSMCIIILRVADDIAYPVVMKNSAGCTSILPSSSIQQVGMAISEMTKRMVSKI